MPIIIHNTHHNTAVLCVCVVSWPIITIQPSLGTMLEGVVLESRTLNHKRCVFENQDTVKKKRGGWLSFKDCLFATPTQNRTVKHKREFFWGREIMHILRNFFFGSKS